jgi:nucleoside-diphosphate-sugar epimerase
MSRRYLITGAQGLVGRYLTARILDLERDAQVVGIGRSKRIDGFFTHAISLGGQHRRAPLPPELLASLDDRYRYRSLSLLDTATVRQVIDEIEPDCVFHLASALHSASDRDLFETNVEGTASLMNAISDAHARKALVILGSSASVYGEPVALPISESHPCEPDGMYGVTKLAAEHIARVKAARMGVAVVTARIFNVVAPGQAESHVCGRFAAQVASWAHRDSQVLDVGPLGATRDFVDARDVAAALLLVAQEGLAGQTYNVASGVETSIHFVLSELIRIAGLEGRVRFSPKGDRPAGVSRHAADTSRLASLGFVPAYPIATSLQDLLRYYRSMHPRAAANENGASPSHEPAPSVLQESAAVRAE